jgi:hypothetical protein
VPRVTPPTSQIICRFVSHINQFGVPPSGGVSN